MAKSVTTIPAKIIPGAEAKKKGLLRVAAYCRVSTDFEEQLTSYKSQIEHYTQKINSNPDWKMVGIFADEGITGTSAKKRPEFNKLMALCRKERVDLIITKSVSRFARNTVDCLSYVRMLRQHNVAVLFEKENINTAEMQSELMLAFYGGFAQSESESLSGNVGLGHRMKMKRGEVTFQYSKMFGYRKGADGQPEIIPEEADVVRRIYGAFLAGHSTNRIKDDLAACGAPLPRSGKSWNTVLILSILQNEKYAGDALLQKTFVSDCISKTVKKNNGELPQYYVKDNHPAIIPREVFNRVQEEFARRNSIPKATTKPTKTNLGRYSSQYALTELISCAECGTAYRRVTWAPKEPGGEKRIVWRCIARLENGKRICKQSPTIPEPLLHEAIMRGVRFLAADHTEVRENVQAAVTKVIRQANGCSVQDLENEISKRSDAMMKLLDERIAAGAAEDCFDMESMKLYEEIEKLREWQRVLIQRGQEDSGADDRITAAITALQQGDMDIREYSDDLARQLIQHIAVVSKDKIIIQFKNGMEIAEALTE